MSDDTIITQRLLIVPVSTAFLEACIAGDTAAAEHILGYTIAPDWFEETWLMQLRLDQANADPAYRPWLIRAIILQDSGVMIGYVNFHTPPDPDYLCAFVPNGIELGYTIFAPYRRRGYGQEAVLAVLEWTNRVRGIQRIVLTISPENVASLRMAHNLGFVKIGQHIDEEDGPEDIFEHTFS